MKRGPLAGILAIVGIGLMGVMAAQQPNRQAVPEQPSDVPIQLKKVSPYEFTNAVIDSLGWVADAREVLTSVGGEGDLTVMTNMRRAITKFEKAKAAVQSFRGSEDPMIQVALIAFANTYDQLILSLNEIIRVNEKLLSAPNRSEYGGLISEQSKWLAEVSKAWGTLGWAVAATTYVLVDNKGHENGRLPYLRITATERTKLLTEVDPPRA